MEIDKIQFEDILDITKEESQDIMRTEHRIELFNSIQGGFEPEENKGADAMSLADKVKNRKKAVEKVSCEYLDQPVDIFSGAIKIDSKTSTIKNATLQTEGWSLNGMGFNTNYLNSLVNKIKERPKMFVGHAVPAGDKDVAGQLRRMDRPANEWAATVRNARVEVAKEGKFKGLNQTKGDIEFTEMDIGQQMFRQAKKDPGSVRISTNVRGMFMEDGELHNKKGDVMDECLLCYSTDFVSYDAAGGGILDSMNSETGEIDLEQATKDSGLSKLEVMCMIGGSYNGSDVGIEPLKDKTFADLKEEYKVLTQKVEEYEAFESKQFSLDNFKLSKDILNAFVALKDRLKQQEMREQFFEIKRFFGEILVEILIDKEGDYPSVAKKKMAFDMAAKQLKDILFGMDLKALKTSLMPFFSSVVNYFENNEPMKGVEKNMAKFEFETIDEIMKNQEVISAIASALPETEVESPFNKGQKVTVKSLLETASDIDGLEVLLPGSDSKVTVGQLKTDYAKLTAAKALSDREESFKAITKKHGISDELIEDDWKESVLAEASADKREEMVKNKKAYLDDLVKNTIEKALKSSVDDETKKKTADGEYIQSLIDDAKKNGNSDDPDPTKVKAAAWSEFETEKKAA